MTKQYLFSIFIIYASVAFVYTTTTQIAVTEPVKLIGEENNVKVHFMDLKKTEFVEALPNVKDAIAELFREFCKSDDGDNCKDLNNAENQNFTRDNFDIVGATDKDKYVEDGRYVIVKLIMKYFDKDNETFYAPKGVFGDFLTKSRDKLVKMSKIDIAYINDKFVYPLRNNLDNYIIIPISVAVMLVLVVINFVCQRKSDNDLRKQFAQVKPSKSTEKVIGDNEEKKSLTGNTSGGMKTEVIQMTTKKSNLEESTHNKSTKSFESNDKQEIKTVDKRKKARKTAEHVAGNITENIGSSRNLTESNKWILDSTNFAVKNDGSNSAETKKKVRNIQENYSFEDPSFGFNGSNKFQPKYISGELNTERKRNKGGATTPNQTSGSGYNFEYPDARVAQRLASYERLPSTYDNVKTNDLFKKGNSGSVKNIDL